MALAAAAILLSAAAVATTRTGLFRVRAIEVDGASHRTRAQVVRLSGITRSDNAVWLPVSRAEALLLRDPWIAGADVEVHLPWSVTITVSERSAVASTRQGVEPVLVAGDGTILGPGRSAGLPTIDAPPAWLDPSGSGDIAHAAQTLSALGADLRSRVRRVVVGGPAGLQLQLTDGLLVRFGGPGDREAKARVLAEVLSWIERTDAKIRAIDVSAPSAPAVRSER